jgi:glucose-6-phosphate isomerase, archaeal
MLDLTGVEGAGGILSRLSTRFDPETGTVEGLSPSERRLSALKGVFADADAYAAALAVDDPVVYRVTSVEPEDGEGALHYGIGVVMPGRVGDEYYLTRGHLHEWRPAGEFYIGLQGEGLLLLEDIRTGHSTLVPLVPNSAVYVPGYAAHRTVNTGSTPLVYLGIYPANAGHDYATVERSNFRQVVVAVDGKPAMVDRAAYMRSR